MTCQFLGPRKIVVTNCTTRKRAPDPPISPTAATIPETLSTFAKRWTALLNDAPCRTPAGNLYIGRAIAQSKSSARSLGADMYIVSAGLGLVSETQLVPNYNLTVAAGLGPLQRALQHSGEPSSSWWITLMGQSTTAVSIADLVCADSTSMVFIALPATYVRMVRSDLAKITETASSKLRLFTSEAGQAEVPMHLRHCVLPYDDRLETVEGCSGTRAEFAQRALRHFVEILHGHQLTASEANAAVISALAQCSRRTVPVRQKQTDLQITCLLRQQWGSYAGSSTRLLRYLRDEALVACEQSRFRTLWQQVQLEHQTHTESACVP